MTCKQRIEFLTGSAIFPLHDRGSIDRAIQLLKDLRAANGGKDVALDRRALAIELDDLERMAIHRDLRALVVRTIDAQPKRIGADGFAIEPNIDSAMIDAIVDAVLKHVTPSDFSDKSPAKADASDF